jgi:serine/threonine protein kinase
VPEHTRPGDVLADRYRLTDLLTESGGGRFWRAFDSVLQRDVAVHIIACDDERAPLLREAARTSATVLDRRMLRVLDIDEAADRCFVVNEWGSGTSLDILLADGEPLSPTVAAWVVAEVADSLALAHEAGVAHGRLVPENVLIDHDGAVRLIGFAVDAALHGLPSGRTSTDVVDLVGLLYAALTGRWAGVSRSVVTAAPSQHGHVLRPRQVRAGIPRTLDALCDHVLNRGGDVDVTAAMVSDTLSDFLGPSATAAEAWLARIDHPRRGQETVVLPALPDPPVREPDFADEPGSGAEVAPDDATPPTDESDSNDETDATDETDVSGLPVADEEPATQAGMPIFHDDRDEVTWLPHHHEPSPPPPPFEPPPERPLFAPDPANGEPARRPRALPVGAQSGGSGFWPWENSATGAGTGSGVLPAFVDDEEEDDRNPPGTSMLRLALIVAVCLVLLIGCVIAFNLGRGRSPLGTALDTPTSRATTGQSSPSASASPTTLTGVTATAFDPQGDPPEENPEEARLAVDGDPSTAWSTQTYTQNFGPLGLKTGVGLVLDLGADHEVNQVDLTTVGSPTQVQIYVTSRKPTSLQGIDVAGQTTVTGTHGEVTLDPAPTGRYVVVWLTQLPTAARGFRGEVAEVVVKGD